MHHQAQQKQGIHAQWYDAAFTMIQTDDILKARYMIRVDVVPYQHAL